MKKIKWTKEQLEIIQNMIGESESIGYDKGYKDGLEDNEKT